MTDKEKIEELKEILFDNAENYCDADGSIVTQKLAEVLDNAGYRKIKEGSIIIEQYIPEEGIKVRTEADVRKETAKEVGQKIYEILEGNFDGGILLFIKDTINGVLERQGVEIEK